jgi:hypothetical protein
LASPPAIGGTFAAPGSFTSLSASSTVSGTGFSNYLASPPPIGGVTPAAGGFTGITLPSVGVVNWNSDTGLSRGAADQVNCGNGTAADASCTFDAATVAASAAITVGTAPAGCGSGGSIQAGCIAIAQVSNSTNVVPTALNSVLYANNTSECTGGNGGWAVVNGTGSKLCSLMNYASVTPALIAAISANTTLANVTSGSASPAAAAIPSGIQNYVAGTGYNQATGHQLQVPLACPDTSGSGTAQSCSTGGTTYTPAAADCIIYTTTTTNSGAGLTVNVDSLGAKSVAIPGASGWTTTLTASIIPANKPLLACYDGTANWNVQQTGTAASGGSSAFPLTVSGTVTSGGIPYFNSTTQESSSALLAANHVLLGGGAGTAPSSDSALDDGATTANTLTYTGSGGIIATTGVVDGKTPITLTTGTTASLGGTYSSGFTLNQEATAATAVTYTLPTPAAGKQYCIKNSYNGSAADTGVLTLAVATPGTHFIIKNGTKGSATGTISSGGAAGDAMCVVGISTTLWEAYIQVGTWTLN